MTEAARKVSLNQMVEEISTVIYDTKSALSRQSSAGSKAGRDLRYRIDRQEAIWKSLGWLRENEAEIKAFMALPAEDRAVIVSHGSMVAELARQLAEKEAIAKAGGPVR